MKTTIIIPAFTLIKHELSLLIRNPFWVFFGLFQPIIYLLLFAPFLNGLASSAGFPGNNAIQFFAPGLLIMNAVMNAGYAGFGLLDKLSCGFIERLKVLPISRISIALGFVIINALSLIFQSILLLVISMLLGLQINYLGFIVLIGLLLMIGIFMSSCSYALSLLINDGGGLASAVSFFTMPLLLLSGIMLPIAYAPQWLQWMAKCNPFYYAVEASRFLISGTIMHTSVLTAFVFFSIIAILGLRWFIRILQNATN